MFIFFYSFGVCCLFIVTATSTTIDQNCTYIQNPSFPSVYSAATALTYTINKCSSDVCSVRLDFETFQIRGPATTLEAANAHNCLDSFVASGTSGITTPVICGLNAGQHSKYYKYVLWQNRLWSFKSGYVYCIYIISMYFFTPQVYVEMGNSGSTDTATLAFTFAGASTTRTWEIKATQVPCGASWR